MTSKLLAHRELTSADLTLFAADKETFLYDAVVSGNNGNYKGQLINVKQFGPGTATPAINLQLVHDAQGHDWKTTETFAAAGYNSIGGRTYTKTFAVSGQPDKILYGDYVGNAGIATSATYHYDARGLPASVDVTRSNQGTQTVALQTRNVAGLVTNRSTTITGSPTSPMTFASRTGRTTRSAASPARSSRRVLARRSLPSRHSHTLATTLPRLSTSTSDRATSSSATTTTTVTS